MDTDHVARLRAAADLLDDEPPNSLRGTSGVCRDAAAEIERLRAALLAAEGFLAMTVESPYLRPTLAYARKALTAVRKATTHEQRPDRPATDHSAPSPAPDSAA